MYKVYLAGPITGLSYEGCTSWRDWAFKELYNAGHDGLDPMRAKGYLAREDCIGSDYDTVLSCSRGIMTRDHWDCTRCDVLLVNLIGATNVSIGTVMEIAWAFECRIPIVLCIEKEGNVHDHAMIREAVGFRVETLEEGLNVVKAILSL
jgi:nucleoside 2-deoxyribosyltransferase